MSLVLISSSATKLEALASRLTQRHADAPRPIKIRTLALDLATSWEGNPTYASALEDLLKECHRDGGLGLLFNNAGLSYPHAEYLQYLSHETVARLVQINALSLTTLIRRCLPYMAHRGKGCIMSVGSGSASVLTADPLYAVYAASKAYVESLTRALSVEYADRGVRVQCVTPLYVATKMSRIRRPSLFAPSPSAYAAAMLRILGRDVVTCAYPPHALMAGVILRAPSQVISYLKYRLGLSIRRRAMDKKNGG